MVDPAAIILFRLDKHGTEGPTTAYKNVCVIEHKN